MEVIRRLLFLLALSCTHASAQSPTATAQSTLGGIVGKTASLTFSTGNWIAAFHRPYADGPKQLVLLRQVGQTYVVSWRADVTPVSDLPNEVYLFDVNKDGYPEVLWVEGGHGTGNGIDYYHLYDVARKTTYESTLNLDFHAGTSEMVYDPRLLQPENEKLLSSVSQVADRNPNINMQATRPPIQTGQATWSSRYGAFVEGKVTKLYAPPVPMPMEICQDQRFFTPMGVTINKVTYATWFKSGVVALNAAQKTCTMVYVSQDPGYEELSVSGKKLVIRNMNKTGTVTFDPVTQYLTHP